MLESVKEQYDMVVAAIGSSGPWGADRNKTTLEWAADYLAKNAYRTKQKIDTRTGPWKAFSRNSTLKVLYMNQTLRPHHFEMEHLETTLTTLRLR